uniref:Uncharacterized protein n=1 Tax=Arundo donax TaxID=35708 RepID=A0A0A9C768_ARUDO
MAYCSKKHRMTSGLIAFTKTCPHQLCRIKTTNIPSKALLHTSSKNIACTCILIHPCLMQKTEH